MFPQQCFRNNVSSFAGAFTFSCKLKKQGVAIGNGSYTVSESEDSEGFVFLSIALLLPSLIIRTRS